MGLRPFSHYTMGSRPWLGGVALLGLIRGFLLEYDRIVVKLLNATPPFRNSVFVLQHNKTFSDVLAKPLNHTSFGCFETNPSFCKDARCVGEDALGFRIEFGGYKMLDGMVT